ncbi:MAG TPA: heparan-alpha-glucosaminide N-acetyltransferase domain-containing protein [Rhodothermales bacterium]|nr:heparan-alpha-glucosaminide N-acetyltransferase domain-containing protein [Rhodothermales bacterium]
MKAANRWVFVDIFRFTAVVLMLQGHTFDAYLAPEIKKMDWFQGAHTFIHGFTSPIFLFSSGLAFGVATFRKWTHFIQWSPALWKRIRRYLLLLAIGYWLHLAYFSFYKILTQMSEKNVLFFFQIDALQIIGITLAFCQFSVYLLKKKKVFIAVLSFWFVSIFFITPYLWGSDLQAFPLWIRGYLDKSIGSYFPIFPWSMYLLAGIISAYFFKKWQESLSLKQILIRFSSIGILCIAIGKPGIEYWINPFKDPDGVYSFLVLHNLGYILLIISCLYWLDQAYIQPKISKNPHGLPLLRYVTLMGQETLAIYVMHLFIVYGSPLNQSILPSMRYNMQVLPALIYALLLFILMFYYARFWSWFKKEKPSEFRTFQIVGTGLLLYLFLINDWVIHLI